MVINSSLSIPYGNIYGNGISSIHNPFKLQDCIVRDTSAIKASDIFSELKSAVFNITEGYRLFKTRNFLKIERI